MMGRDRSPPEGEQLKAQPQPESSAQPRRLLWPRDVAAILGVPERTLADWRYRGEGPRAFRVGRHVRYVESDLVAWINQRAAS